VRGDELEVAWDIFTPLLHQLDAKAVDPILYEFGSKGPKESDDFLAKFGYVPSPAKSKL
jgi:glucose-6-phosphate 1-dehydrogenase